MKGNHDRYRDLNLLRRLRTTHPVIVEEAAGIHVIAGVAFSAVAWPDIGSLSAMLGRPLPPDTVDAFAREALRSVLTASAWNL